MKTILLIGAGKSATVLIDYLTDEAEKNNWKFIIADANKEQILLKTKNSRYAEAVELDITNEKQRSKLIEKSHVVISMMPPHLHFLVAKDCVEYRKHLLTASYLDKQISSLRDEISNRKLLFLCEMGLDPGIDHMSALLLLNRIKSEGGDVVSFRSHCGGLVAPESDDNPWHYKISWNPRNVVLAGKAGAVYKENNHTVTEKYDELFRTDRAIPTGDETIGSLSYYPNRDSLPYLDLYQLHHVETFVRTTLRYPDFMEGWKHIIALNLTDETISYESDGRTLQDFFQAHAGDKLSGLPQLVVKQLNFLGMDDSETFINKGLCSAADVLQMALETKLVLQPHDKDLVVMVHEIEYIKDGAKKLLTSSLIVKGEDSMNTAMAKTVGLPLGIAAKLILEDKLKLKGLHIPTSPVIYEPVLEELEKHGISFVEKAI
ncbi:saccharopine dehydrogenase C-terminal domain-containing protein [Ferruginibacter sp. HRS2-29]|uniref:saccharopine dehydrogenase C-terminal domain-containing protein n=1 Tax=Ferruginibacter sp. HRS2-29 TaxID=2487334 RepID=UPI0020CD8021|nr:saccharopine dehydrogenase C-terminal domain-containing protein [Ferruginibacter sp. HRS2-29]MCP9752068.1 saccharopine dehydrogenase [Ferruginibacter sp. HRS2-29]